MLTIQIKNLRFDVFVELVDEEKGGVIFRFIQNSKTAFLKFSEFSFVI